MPIYILYFLAAGAVSIGGPAIGVALYNRGQQEAAASEGECEIATLKRLLQSQIDLQDLRAQAQRAGVDPDAVARGYYELRGGHITLDQVAARIDAWSRR
jgi:hypothetical protein